MSTTLLTDHGAQVEMREDGNEVTLVLRSDAAGPGAREGAGLVCQALTRARARHAHRVRTTLTASEPSCGIVLDALRTRVGRDVDAMTLRRAGSSVLVTVDLAPARDDHRRNRGPIALSTTPVGG